MLKPCTGVVISVVVEYQDDNLNTSVFYELRLNVLIAKSEICSPIEREDVAPGDGAFKTCIASSLSAMLKSCNNLPLLSTA